MSKEAGSVGAAPLGPGWWLLAGLAVAGGALTATAVASIPAQEYPPFAAGIAVLVGSFALSLGVPVAAALGLARILSARGRAVRTAWIAVASILTVNIGGVVLAQSMGPVPIKQLWPERGTWAFDAVTGQGPYGPAAMPVVSRELESLRAADSLAVAGPLLCDAGAAAVAVGLARGLSEAAGPGPFASTLDGVLGRHGIEVSAGLLPGPLVAGRALLADVADLAAAIAPAAALEALPEVDFTPTEVSRRRIVGTTPGWEARYEDGAWHVCPGTAENGLLRGRALAAAMWGSTGRDAATTRRAAAPAGPFDAEVRDALERALRGRAAWLTGVSGPDLTWPESLTRVAAAAQAEQLRAWCVLAADANRAGVVAGIGIRWGMPSPGTDADPAARALVDAQGRRYLEEVVAACAPVAADRQALEAARGLPISEAERARWAALGAATLAREAVLSDDGAGGVRLVVDGRPARAIQEEGAWRIDLR